MRLKTLLSYLLLLTWLPIAIAMDSQGVIDDAERIQFAKGQFSAVMTGQMDVNITEKYYVLRANSGQTMSIQLNSNTPDSFISVLKVTGNQLQEIASSSSSTPTHWSSTLTSNADYIIRVGLTKSNAIKIHYRLEVSIYSDDTTIADVKESEANAITPISPPAIKSVEESVKEASEQAIPSTPTTPKTTETVDTEPTPIAEKIANNDVGMLVTSAEIEGDYVLNRNAKLNVLKIFGNRVFIRITGLGQTTCNFTGSGLLTSDVVTIHNKFIGETLKFSFLPDTIIVTGGNKAGAFCAGDMTVVGKYVRPHLLPPVQIAEPSQPTSNKPQATNMIDMLQCRCSTFNDEPAAIQQIMHIWMNGFRQGKKASTNLSVDLSTSNMASSLADLKRYCAANTNLYLLQVHDDLTQANQQAATEVEEGTGAFAFMRRLVTKVENIIEDFSSKELNMSKYLCFDFRKQGEENQRVIMSWVLGYGQGRVHNFSDIPVDFTVNFLDQNIKVLNEYCATHQAETLIKAADALSSR